MKALFKTLFAAFAALTLTLSLSGCFEEGAKTASQGDNASSLAPDSGKVKLALEAGDAGIFFYFKGVDADTAVEKLSQAIPSLLKEKGIAVETNLISGDSSLRILFVEFEEPLSEKTTLNIEKTAMKRFRVMSSSGSDVARWDPSFGSQSRRV